MVVEEWLEFGSLSQYLAKVEYFEEGDALFLFKNICLALKDL